MFESITLTEEILKELHLIENMKIEPLNIEYESCHYQINDKTYRSRRAKKTLNKQGYFVVFWIKDENNKNRPYTYEETLDKLIVTIIDERKKGQFAFPKDLLYKKKIISSNNITGKMAMRVYPTWEDNLNKTASQTQKWQKDYFIDLSDKVDIRRLTKLYY